MILWFYRSFGLPLSVLSSPVILCKFMKLQLLVGCRNISQLLVSASIMLTASLFFITVRLERTLSPSVLRLQWEGHVCMWVGERAAKHCSHVATLDDWKLAWRIMPWKCVPQALCETFTDHWRKKSVQSCSLHTLCRHLFNLAFPILILQVQR